MSFNLSHFTFSSELMGKLDFFFVIGEKGGLNGPEERNY